MVVTNVPTTSTTAHYRIEVFIPLDSNHVSLSLNHHLKNVTYADGNIPEYVAPVLHYPSLTLKN